MTRRTITTDATARRERDPELATVDAKATGEGEEAATARALARDRAATIRESVAAVPADRIQTVEMEVRETTDLFGEDSDAAYRATERFEIACVPETAEAVVVDVTDAGGTVQSVEFHVHDEVRRQLQDEALAAAMERARAKATQIAAAEGLAVAEVQSVTTREISTGMDSIVDDALSGPADDDFSPTPVSVSEGVEVVYELTEA